MVDVNFGNKTLIVGVAIALILSYGMVNFNSAMSSAGVAASTPQAVAQIPATADPNAPVTAAADSDSEKPAKIRAAKRDLSALDFSVEMDIKDRKALTRGKARAL
jgi:hypothetical protein